MIGIPGDDRFDEDGFNIITKASQYLSGRKLHYLIYYLNLDNHL